MACFLCMAWFSNLQFYITHHVGEPLVTCRNYDGVDQTVVPKSSGFCELLIEGLHVTSLSSHPGVWKLIHAFFQRVWWPKMSETVTFFVHLYTTCAQIKDSTAVPRGLLQPLSVPEFCFSSWSIDFTTNFPLCHRCNTILTYVEHLTKSTNGWSGTW